jgi:hypothetical protein
LPHLLSNRISIALGQSFASQRVASQSNWR